MADEIIKVERVEIAAREANRADQHPVSVYLARLGGKSKAATISHIKKLAAIASSERLDMWTLPWAELRYQHIGAIRQQLADRYAPGSANTLLAVLRGIMRECWHLGHISAEEFHRLAEVPPVKGSRLPKGRALAAGEIRALFEVCALDKKPAGRRDAAMLAILYGCGLRRSEVVHLDLADYDPEAGSIKVRAGKGNKDRLCYTTGGTRQAIEDWLSARRAEPGPLFTRIGKGDRITSARLTDQAVLVILQRRAEQAKVTAFSPHDLRRTFVGDLLEAGADISTVQQLAGHSQISTTQRYDRRGEATKKKAADLLHVPFVK